MYSIKLFHFALAEMDLQASADFVGAYFFGALGSALCAWGVYQHARRPTDVAARNAGPPKTAALRVAGIAARDNLVWRVWTWAVVTLSTALYMTTRCYQTGWMLVCPAIAAAAVEVAVVVDSCDRPDAPITALRTARQIYRFALLGGAWALQTIGAWPALSVAMRAGYLSLADGAVDTELATLDAFVQLLAAYGALTSRDRIWTLQVEFLQFALLPATAIAVRWLYDTRAAPRPRWIVIYAIGLLAGQALFTLAYGLVRT
jgi:hypothetical protein